MLTGQEILKRIEREEIVIKPFDPEQIQPNSYDVRLAPILLEILPDQLLDFRKLPSFAQCYIHEGGLKLEGGHCYLGVTAEWISTAGNLVAALHGRSTVARYFMTVHQTAGFGDAGFYGHWTLELRPAIDIVVYPNMRIGQIRFEEVTGKSSIRYTGKYISEKPVPNLPVPGNFR